MFNSMNKPIGMNQENISINKKEKERNANSIYRILEQRIDCC